MDDQRLNSPTTSAVLLDVFGHQLRILQDPNSKHLGTTVWDASMVFVKFLEKNSRKGRFSPSKMKGKRVIELGAGCGLAGLGMALLGCDVTSTDQVEVLPLLMRNLERNRSWISKANTDTDTLGSITVAELDWGNKEHIKAVDPPFDYIIGTDVVYAEHLLEPLLQTILALAGPRTKIVLGYEIRSTAVHDQMIDLWKRYFVLKTVQKSKMDAKYRHPSIQLFMMDLLAPFNKCGDDSSPSEMGDADGDEEEVDALPTPVDSADAGKCIEDCIKIAEAEQRPLDDWEIRRCGVMAARVLSNVKLT